MRLYMHMQQYPIRETGPQISEIGEVTAKVQIKYLDGMLARTKEQDISSKLNIKKYAHTC